MATYTAGLHQEIPDQTPIELPVGYRVPETLEQLIARLIHSNDVKKYVAAQGAETFEEADDFDVDEDIDMSSPYELKPMQEEYVAEKQPKQPQERSNPNSPIQKSDGSEQSAPESNTAESEAIPAKKRSAKVKKVLEPEVVTE